MKTAAAWIGALLLLGCCSAASASYDQAARSADALASEMAAEVAPGDEAVRERLDWRHPGLELLLWDLGETEGFVRLRFAVELKIGHHVGRTWIGFPRYRMGASARWDDAVYQGPHGRNRVLEVAEHAGGRAFFSVMVPPDATSLRLPIGEGTLELDIAEWLSSSAPRRALYAGDRTDSPALLRDRVAEAEARASEELPPYEAEEPFPAIPPGRPVRLQVDLRWLGDKPFGDGALDVGESGEILVDVINDGDRPASGLKVRITPAGIPGVTFPAEVRVPTIDPDLVETVSVPFRGETDMAGATHRLTLQVVEPFGHDGPPIEFELTTRGAPLPELMLIDDFALEGAGLPVPRDTIVTIRLRARNVGAGTAQGVIAVVTPADGVYPAHDSEQRFELGDLASGEIGEFVFRCYANRRAENLALQIDLSEDRSRPATIASQVVLPLEDSPTTARIVRVAADPAPQTELAPAPAALTSDIDRSVPQAVTSRPDALAVVLGVESYVSAPPAVFSADDARTAARYFEHALGIPARRIQLLLDHEVTLAQMQRVFGKDGWLARRMHETSEVFVFFSGHGMAATGAFEPYILPSDGDVDYVQQTGFPLDLLIDSLAELDAARVTVFIDACFSGMTRDGDPLLDGARPLALVPARRKLTGVSLFSAARGTQLASTDPARGHGLFSYFVFKGLGGEADLDGGGEVTAGELKFYLEERVPRAAAELDREQTPSVFLEDAGHVLVRY